MNIFKLILGRGIYNAPCLDALDRENNEKLELLVGDIEKELGYTVNKEVIRVLALKKFLDCYSKQDILRILKYFQMLRGANNVQHIQKQENS